ncbi:MAG: BolA/IbaG family iron-sulfur metabolism protein [Porticoccaceae bacterium]|jgi:acid stress-induced BolA-like protein IbaG/YrbA|nr:BolA/IbaG family iron-sulfur metabolism protein [Porticoccaceae bacterium]MEA3300682.1 BolA/IbaG family iron-sulfur metabolism protein [Pseudomonadota bacterium]HLS98703.1 BolA/IbaG family iron-sulfur metabolism protein [Porticoccaceae bacterium]
METTEIEAILQAALPDCEIRVQGDGRHFDLLIVGEVFAGLRTIKRQQMIYGILNEHIASGRLHAVNMERSLLTPAEFAVRDQ